MKTRRTPPARRRHRGFSMIETLIAAALIGVVAIGIIPLFTRSMVDNMAGSDYTRVTNYAKSKEEDFARIPWLQQTIQIPAGQTSAMTTEFMDPALLQWVPTQPGNPLAVWTRGTTYTQYNIADTDTGGVFSNALDGGDFLQPDRVHIIQAQVQVKSVAAIGPMGVRRTTLVRYLKGF
jgi:prepilin-type N-terminal cleavage/methylation domain-containing protein